MRKIVVLNIISITKIKEFLVGKNNTINYGNHHLAINNIIDVSKLVKLLVKEIVFEEQFGQICKAKTLDLFANKTAKMAIKISLHKY